jgi:rhamnosyltransferase
MKKMPKIAIFLAAYNGMEWINQQLQSILMQIDVEVSVFISIDPSSDGTLQWCSELAAQDKRIKVLSPTVRFGGAAKNFFHLIREVDFSTYDYIAFADQDDIWLPNKLSRACEVLSKTHADAYSSNVMAFWEDGRESLIIKSQPQVKWDFLFEAAGPGCTYVFTRALAISFKAKLNERWSLAQSIELHDWLLYAFARANQFKWVIDDCANMRYRQHEKNQVGVNQGWQAKKQRLSKLFSGWLFGQSALIADFVGLSAHSFVRPWQAGNRAGFGFLAVSFYQCRRRVSEKIVFLALCLVFMIKGKGK